MPLSIELSSIEPGKEWIADYGLPSVSVTCIIYGAPAIGGFIAVGQMISSYGVCVQVN
jgi:hypothetical protein